MEAQQCVKLSLTNRSIGLIPPHGLARDNRGKRTPSRPEINLSRLAPPNGDDPDSCLAKPNSERDVLERKLKTNFDLKTR